MYVLLITLQLCLSVQRPCICCIISTDYHGHIRAAENSAVVDTYIKYSQSHSDVLCKYAQAPFCFDLTLWKSRRFGVDECIVVSYRRRVYTLYATNVDAYIQKSIAKHPTHQINDVVVVVVVAG